MHCQRWKKCVIEWEWVLKCKKVQAWNTRGVKRKFKDLQINIWLLYSRSVIREREKIFAGSAEPCGDRFNKPINRRQLSQSLFTTPSTADTTYSAAPSTAGLQMNSFVKTINNTIFLEWQHHEMTDPLFANSVTSKNGSHWSGNSIDT